jgi:hypothetical protein
MQESLQAVATPTTRSPASKALTARSQASRLRSQTSARAATATLALSMAAASSASRSGPPVRRRALPASSRMAA